MHLLFFVDLVNNKYPLQPAEVFFIRNAEKRTRKEVTSAALYVISLRLEKNRRKT